MDEVAAAAWMTTRAGFETREAMRGQSIHHAGRCVSRVDAAAEVVAGSVDGIEHDVRGGVTASRWCSASPRLRRRQIFASTLLIAVAAGRSPVVTELPQSLSVPVGGSSNTATVQVVTVLNPDGGPMWRRCRQLRMFSRDLRLHIVMLTISRDLVDRMVCPRARRLHPGQAWGDRRTGRFGPSNGSSPMLNAERSPTFYGSIRPNNSRCGADGPPDEAPVVIYRSHRRRLPDVTDISYAR